MTPLDTACFELLKNLDKGEYNEREIFDVIVRHMKGEPFNHNLCNGVISTGSEPGNLQKEQAITLLGDFIERIVADTAARTAARHFQKGILAGEERAKTQVIKKLFDDLQKFFNLK